jgi:hypothetical protein
MTDNADPKVEGTVETPPPDGGKVDGQTTVTPPNPVDKEVVEKYVEERVNTSLKDIKAKLDSAFEARDQALKKIAEYEKKEREAEVKRLKEEGKEREAYEMQLAQERARAEALERQNTELTRDVEVRGLLSGLNFRNDKANEMAYREIIQQLVRDEKNVWVHRSGIPIKEFIKQFAESDDNAFLFKAKVSTGSGAVSPTGKKDTSGGKKSLFAMSQEEVIKLATEGKL